MKDKIDVVLPVELYDQLSDIAHRNGTSTMELLRRFVKIGLLVDKVAQDPIARLFIEDGSGVREVTLDENTKEK